MQIYQDTKDGRHQLEELDATGQSSRKPGMAETMGVGAVTGNLAMSAVVSGGIGVASEALSADVEADAKRLTGKVAGELKSFFEQQVWTR